MTDIHKTAIVSPDATIGENVTVGPYAIIEDNVVLGEGVSIGSSAVIAYGARLGKNVKVYHGAIVGSVPQDLKFEGEETEAIIGDNTIIREYATLNRGTKMSGATRVGQNCLLMAYSHVAHDCIIGNNVIMGNSVNLAGHIEIDDYAAISGVVPVHQFVKIGAHSYIGGGFRVPQDICPYALVAGYPLKIAGINAVGLKRRGFSNEALKAIRRAYKFLFYSELNTTQAVEKIRAEIEPMPEVQVILDFIERSERGLTK